MFTNENSADAVYGSLDEARWSMECDENGNVTEAGEYYLLKTKDLEKLGMESSKDEYIVKYNTGEVINKTTPQNSKGESIHLKGN